MFHEPSTHPDAPVEGGASTVPTDSGQTTAEYALVLLGAAGIAALLLGWAARSGAISSLFDAVLSGVMDHLK